MPRPKYWILPYKAGSQSVSELVDRLGAARAIKPEDSKYVWQPGDVVVNWGSGHRHPWMAGVSQGRGRLFNQPERVAVATSKLRTFDVLRAGNVGIPEVTRDQQVAVQWLATGKVVARSSDHGKGGEGIKVYRGGDRITEAALFYTTYFRKQREFRVHVFEGRVIFEQEKKRRTEGRETADPYIRSHDKGWIFAFRHLPQEPVPEAVRAIAIAAVRTLGLDFGAVDIGWNERQGPCVFEVNTAPGIEGETADAYQQAIGAT